MNLHKCGKKIKVVSLNSSHENKCPCGTEMPFDCCKDIHVCVKIIDAQKESKQISVQHSTNFKSQNIPVILSIGKPSSQVDAFNFANYHAPPFKNKLPVYLANNIFRI